MDERETALFLFRKLVFALYSEIGALQPQNHPEVAQKADLTHGFFQREREKQAAQLYLLTEQAQQPDEILQPYVDRTGLTLADVERAFREGNWQNKFQGYTFGGPRWARIAEMAIQLKDVIERQAWDEARPLSFDIKKTKHNRGLLIDLFDRTERYRS